MIWQLRDDRYSPEDCYFHKLTSSVFPALWQFSKINARGTWGKSVVNVKRVLEIPEHPKEYTRDPMTLKRRVVTGEKEEKGGGGGEMER